MGQKVFDTDIYKFKSKESYNASELCGEKELFNSWANRAYYAVYILASIFLEKQRIEPLGTSNNQKYYKHTQVVEKMSWLLRKNNQTKKLMINRILNDLYRNRGIADYATDRNVEKLDYENLQKRLKEAYNEFKDICLI